MSNHWAVIQYDNRPLPHNFIKIQNQNREYCRKHGYTYIFSMKNYDMPPYWGKIKMAKDVMDKNLYKGILWLDMDAVIHDMETPLDKFERPGKSFYYCSDAPKWTANFNAGVWLILSTQNGKDILQDWMDAYNPKDWWMDENGTWQTHGIWGGPTYEQGTFDTRILPKYSSTTEKLPWYTFQSDVPLQASFTLHFAGTEKDEKISNYFLHR
jgi:hypothetical protein